MTGVDLLRGHIKQLRQLRPGCIDPGCLVCERYRSEDAAADSTLDKLQSTVASALQDDLAAAYELIASWQLDHRRQFPHHLTEATLLVRCSERAEVESVRFTVKLLADIDDGLINKPPRLFVEAHGATAREAAEGAIVGADTNVAESATEWSRT